MVESLVNEGCVVEGNVEQSVLFPGVQIGSGSEVKKTVVMPTAKIGSNVYIENAIVPSDIEVPDGTIIRPTKGSEEVILVTQELIESVAKCI